MSDADVIASYRQRILRDTEYLVLPAEFWATDQAGMRVPVKVPLRRNYVRLQALWDIPAEADDDQHESFRRNPKQIDILTTLSQSGEELYRCGQIYRAVERPAPIEPDALLQVSPRLVLLGAAGSGKSTLLRLFARHAALRAEAPAPILLRVKDYALYRQADGQQALADFAIHQAAQGDPVEERAIANAETKLWLIDGLEDGCYDLRPIINQIQQLPGQIVLTSRPTGYQLHGLETFAHCEVLLMPSEKITQFLQDWFVFLSRTLNFDQEWAEKRVQWIKTELTRRPHLHTLAGNPFLLTCLGMRYTHAHLMDFPERRSELYRAWLAGIASAFPVESSDASTPNMALQGVYDIGWRTHQSACTRHMPNVGEYAALVERVQNGLPAQPGESDEQRRERAAAIVTFWQQAGVLEFTPRQTQTFVAFRHAGLREYAAAEHMAQDVSARPHQAWKEVLRRSHHAAWREPIILLAGMLPDDDLKRLVHHLLQGRSAYEHVLHRDLRLAAIVLREQGERLDPLIAGQVIRRLAALIQASEPPRLLILSLTYLLGVGGIIGIPLFAQFPFSWVSLLTVFILWTLFWLAMLITHEFPGFQGIVSLPLRFWKMIPGRAWLLRVFSQSGSAAATPYLIQALHDSQDDVRRNAAEALGHLTVVEAVPQLIDLLHDSNDIVRRTAARALGEIGAIPRLVQALNDSDRRVRSAASEALQGMSRAQAIPHLALMLHDGKDYVRKAAVETLKQIGGPQTIIPLIHALKDPLKDIRLVAAETLGELAKSEGVYSEFQTGMELIHALHDDELQVRWAAAYALGQIGDTTILADLIQALKGNKTYVRRALSDALRRVVRTPSVLALLQALRDEDTDVRMAALEALGDIGQQESPHFQTQIASEMLPLLQDADPCVRRLVAETLGRLHERAAIAPLLECLEDPVWQVRWAVVEALGKLGDRNVVPYLLDMVHDSQCYVARMATEALGYLGGSETVPVLIQALRSEKLIIQRTADEALKRIGEAHTVPYLLQSLHDEHEYIRQNAELALRHLSQQQAIPYLLEALQAKEEYVLNITICALGHLRAVDTVPQLTSFLTHPHETVRYTVAETLGEIGDARAVPALIAALQDDSKTVRKIATKVLGKMKAAEAVPDLLSMLDDPDLHVRSSVVEALGKIEQFEAVPALLMALQDDAWSVRWTAAYALSVMRDPRIARALIAITKDANSNVRRAAVEGLGKLGDSLAVPHLLEALMDEEWVVRWAAASALGQLRDDRATAALLRALADPSTNVRWAAIEALGKIRAVQALPYVLPLLRDGNWDVRTAAANTIRQIATVEALPDLLLAIKSGDDGVYRIASSAVRRLVDSAAIPALIQGLKDEHPLVREMAAEQLVRMAEAQAVPLLLPVLKHDHWMARHTAVQVIGQLVHTIDDPGLLRRVARALWWRLTDKTEVAQAAFVALEQAANRLSVLDVEQTDLA